LKYRCLEAITMCPTVCARYAVGVFVLSTLLILGSITVYPRPVDDVSMTLPKLVSGIVARSAELIYVTEQDSEVFSFYRNAPVTKISERVFLDLLRRPADTTIETESWSAFFQLRTQRDPTGRWRRLQTYLEANLTDRIVYRLPHAAPSDSQYDLYAVGIFNGMVVGVQMFGVAT